MYSINLFIKNKGEGSEAAKNPIRDAIRICKIMLKENEIKYFEKKMIFTIHKLRAIIMLKNL